MRIEVSVTVNGRSIGRRLSRRLLVVFVVVALAAPGVAAGFHLFSDVPTSHTFHTNIANLAHAGVTAGCGGGKYCPDDPVTRGQMAGFLNRGLGRVALVNDSSIETGTDTKVIVSNTITPGTSPGSLPGAAQFIRADYTGTLTVQEFSGCPCLFVFTLYVGTQYINFWDVEVTARYAGDAYPVSVTGLIGRTGSDPVTVDLKTLVDSGGTSTTQYVLKGNLVLTTIPFGPSGG